MQGSARSLWKRLSILATVSLALILGLLSPLAWVKDPTPPKVYSTALGESRRVTLSPHAVAQLNTDTTLVVANSPAHCDIALTSGEALFEIRPDDLHKVRVTAGHVTLDTDASTFAVRLHDPDHVEVLVRKGDVKLEATASTPDSAYPTQTIGLVANQSAHVLAARVMLKKFNDSEVRRRLAWTSGYLSFRGETLDEVAEEFNRYNPQRLVVADKRLGRLRIGGKFHSTDPEGFAAALRPMGVRRLATGAGDGGLIRLVSARDEAR